MKTATAKRKGIDRETKNWIRNASDERAAKNGCRFDAERGQFVVNWVQSMCCLYEGERAGQQMELRDWQYEATMRLFGWVKKSEDWGREVRRFRKARIWCPKKNKKSPTLAAWGLYLFVGDGEQGQKVFSCAKDGKQAAISHTHAIEMLKRSETLLSECEINKTTGRIVHLPSTSFYSVISGDNIEGQEGLNGSLLVDEVHVVDRRLMDRLKRAGISRSEPLDIGVSTVGNDPEGYGKSEWDYGQRIESGDFTDETFLHMAYAAPQDLADEDLEKNLVEIGKAANPAWGHTIMPTEFVADYQSSKHSISELANFKMYRLNIWQRAANPWLKTGDWEKCRRDFTEEDLAGQECWAGLDLSKTRDMSALVLVFRGDEPEEFKLLPFFWMPETRAKENNHLVQFLQWAKDGYLFLTPGDVIDYGFIKSTFRRLAGVFGINELAYDKTYAEELTQTLEQGQSDDQGNIIEEGTGVVRHEFGQTMMNFAGPTADFERLVIAGKMHHNNHPILNWQIGHVQSKTDNNGNRRPIKPMRGDIRTVDGVVAAVMGHSRAMLGNGVASYHGEMVL